MTHLGKLNINKMPCIVNHPLMPLHYSSQVHLYSFFSPLTLFSLPCGVIWTSVLFKGSFLLIWSRSPAWKSTYLKYVLAWRGNNRPYESYLLRPMFYAVVQERSSPPLDEDQFVSIPLLLNRMKEVEVLRSSGNIFFLFPACSLACVPMFSNLIFCHCFSLGYSNTSLLACAGAVPVLFTWLISVALSRCRCTLGSSRKPSIEAWSWAWSPPTQVSVLVFFTPSHLIKAVVSVSRTTYEPLRDLRLFPVPFCIPRTEHNLASL